MTKREKEALINAAFPRFRRVYGTVRAWKIVSIYATYRIIGDSPTNAFQTAVSLTTHAY